MAKFKISHESAKIFASMVVDDACAYAAAHPSEYHEFLKTQSKPAPKKKNRKSRKNTK